MSTEFTLEKMELNKRIGSMEAKLDVLIPEIQKSNESLTKIITGNGHPESGLVFRIALIESKESGKKQNSTAIWTFISSLAVLVIADVVHRVFFSHPKG